jgi:hypothetical protein
MGFGATPVGEISARTTFIALIAPQFFTLVAIALMLTTYSFAVFDVATVSALVNSVGACWDLTYAGIVFTARDRIAFWLDDQDAKEVLGT